MATSVVIPHVPFNLGRGNTILEFKRRTDDSVYVLVDRGDCGGCRYVVGTATNHSLDRGEWFWGHYFAGFPEAFDYYSRIPIE